MFTVLYLLFNENVKYEISVFLGFFEVNGHVTVLYYRRGQTVKTVTLYFFYEYILYGQ